MHIRGAVPVRWPRRSVLRTSRYGLRKSIIVISVPGGIVRGVWGDVWTGIGGGLTRTRNLLFSNAKLIFD